MVFLTVLPVPPSRARPPSRMGEVVYEHPFNTSLQKARPSTRILNKLSCRVHRCCCESLSSIFFVAVRLHGPSGKSHL